MPASSIASSEDLGSKADVDNMILEEPMFYVLGQFLQTEDDKNVATVMQELTKEVRELKELLASFLKMKLDTSSESKA